MAVEPQDRTELFDFYQNQVKLYYSAVQSENELPVEVLFEINAAFDHLSRLYVYGEDEAVVVRKAYSHLKRSCLDVFKVAVREALKKYKELQSIDISLIDNGEFEKDLKRLVSEIKKGAVDARRLEGDPRTNSGSEIPAFDRWVPVYENCLRLEDDFYNHASVDWAKHKGRRLSLKTMTVSIIASVLLGGLLRPVFEKLIDSLF